MALFCTDTFFDSYADRIAEIAPDLDVIALRPGEEVSAADIERITMVFFSNDAWPERAAPFFKVSLSAGNVKWFHSMSAGVDSPVFATFLERGARLTTSSGAERAADRRHGDALPARVEPWSAPDAAGSGSTRVGTRAVP